MNKEDSRETDRAVATLEEPCPDSPLEKPVASGNTSGVEVSCGVGSEEGGETEEKWTDMPPLEYEEEKDGDGGQYEEEEEEEKEVEEDKQEEEVESQPVSTEVSCSTP